MPFDGAENVAVKVIDEMLTLLATSDGWCKFHLALDENGVDVDCTDPTAVQFCLIGALAKVWNQGLYNDGLYTDLPIVMREEACARNYRGGVVSFNNDPKTTHADVIDYLHAVRQRLQS